MMYSEFIDFCAMDSPLALTTWSVPMVSIIALAMRSLVRDQMSTTLL